MKTGIHPEYKLSKIKCACGATFESGTTVGDLKVDICSACHPFFTGKQKLVDATGKVEKYRRKYEDKLKELAAEEETRKEEERKAREEEQAKLEQERLERKAAREARKEERRAARAVAAEKLAKEVSETQDEPKAEEQVSAVTPEQKAEDKPAAE